MLDEEEHALVMKRWMDGKAFLNSPGARAYEKPGVPLAKNKELLTLAFRAMLDAYEQFTGYRETDPNVIHHHRVDRYGPPCTSCHKPLRTPKARFCAACGAEREPAA
jgi:hypothetical protein